MMLRFDVTNENSFDRYIANLLITSRFQKFLLEVDTTDTRGFYANPKKSAAWHRVTAGDLDTTVTKMVHMVVEQHFSFNAGISVDDPILNPCFFANPDSMDTRALYTFRRARDTVSLGTVVTDIFGGPNGDTIWIVTDALTSDSGYVAHAPRLIAYNNSADYERFTEQTQDVAVDRLNTLSAWLEAGRTTFDSIRSQPHPVLTMVQVNGFIDLWKATDWPKRWTHWSIPHPTWITTHAWCAIASGLDGIVFSDFAFDGTGEFGVRHWISGDSATEYCDTMSTHDPLQTVDWATRRWLLPRMWVGFGSRWSAIKRFMDELRDAAINLLAVYETLDREVVRRHLRIEGSTIDDIIPISSVEVGLARLHARDSTGGFLDSTSGGAPVLVDSADSDMLVSWHRTRDTRKPSSYLTFVNLRQWPADDKTYGARYQQWAPAGSATTGFGAIDVRRPYIVPTRYGRTPCDSIIVEWVGHEEEFSVVVPADSGIGLEWLTPGWGAMYRLTPIRRGVSALGTAYNNSVRSVNPSTSSQ